MHIKKILQSCLLLLIVAGCSTPTSSTHTSKPYPLKVCLVSGNQLDSMGETITETYEGQEVKFCCEPCVKKFHAHPERYLQKLR